MIRKLIYILSILLLCIGCSQKPTQVKGRDIDMSYIVMHKGLHFGGKLAPENSLDAINLAARVGAKYIEIDVGVTMDGEIVLLHDHYLNNTCNMAEDYSPIKEEKLQVSKIAYEDLKNNYVFISDNPAMRRPIPTLKEALMICKSKGLYPYIEIKENFTKEEDVKKVYDIATDVLGKKNYSITSFLTWAILYLRSIDSEVELYRDMIEDADFLKIYNINYYPHYEPSWYNAPPDFEKNISEIHKAGLLASTWTVPKEAYDTIVVKGYDGILTDDIAPKFQKEYAIFDDYSDNLFKAYDIEGILSDNVVILNKGQSIDLKALSIDSLYLGGLYFSVEALGAFEVQANGFHVERENLRNDYQQYQFQYLFHNEKPFFRLTAKEDSVRIKSIWLAITKY